MGNNKQTGQLVGPFSAKEELYTKIKKDAASSIKSIKHLGIQADRGSIFIMNNKEFEIGITEIYEIENIVLTSLYFKNDMDNAIIDYVIEI